MTDLEACPIMGVSPIVTGAATVFIVGLPAARKGDKLGCGGVTQIESGSPTVSIEGSLAARVTDTTCHKGVLTTGAVTVLIGNGGGSRSTTLDEAHRNSAPFVRA
jgi:uncharacterized Zn-binding protein involved in type VI secretion